MLIIYVSPQKLKLEANLNILLCETTALIFESSELE